MAKQRTKAEKTHPPALFDAFNATVNRVFDYEPPQDFKYRRSRKKQGDNHAK